METINEKNTPSKRKNRKKYLNKVLSEASQILLEEEQADYKTIEDKIRGFNYALKDGAEETRSFLDNEGKSSTFRDFLKSGEDDGSADDDVVKISEAPQTLESLQPSQGFIDAGQSVSFSFCNYKFGFKPPLMGGPYTAKDPLSCAGDVILDGHHRWSGGVAVNPKAQINTRDFGVKGDPGQKLAKMQAAVASQTPANQPIPSKSGDKSGDIMGKSAAELEPILTNMLGKAASEFDGKADDEIILGDKFINDLKADTGNRAQLKSVFGITEDDLNNVKPEQTYASFDAIDCPVRKKIIAGSSKNLASMRKQAAGTPKERDDMPQLDHDDIGGDAGFAQIRRDLAKGRINIESPYVNENKQLKRWNKLAGLLKD